MEPPLPSPCFHPCPSHFATRNRAFTLIELLVVITIIAILAALLFPAFKGVQNSALSTASLNNLRQIHVLMVNYCANNNGAYPLSVDQSNPSLGYEPTWRRTIWESTYGPFKGNVMTAMQNSDYSKVMWCPLMTKKYGQLQHPAGQGSYGMNCYFEPPNWRWPNNIRTQTVPETEGYIGKVEPYIIAGAVLQSTPNIGTFYHIDFSKSPATSWDFFNYVYGSSGDMALGLFIDGHAELISKDKGIQMNASISDPSMLE